MLQFCANRGLVPPPPKIDLVADTYPPGGPFPPSDIVIAQAPTEMSAEERGFLFALARGCQPRRALEIGTAGGGSSLILATAMEENGGAGQVWTIDPAPEIAFDQNLYRGRVHQVTGASPGAVEEVAATAGDAFDFALIDGIHIYRQAKADLDAVIPHLVAGAFVLLHDAFHFGVSEAIRELVEADERVHDCGYPCNRPRPVGERATHGGFRLLRFGDKAVDVRPLVAPVWESLGLPPALLATQMNHDFWYCNAVEPCDYCRQHGPEPLARQLLGQ